MRIKIPTTEYISIHLMLLFIDVNEILFGPYVLFQYISCYCLSMIGLAKGDDHPVFQYISCYCLSPGAYRDRLSALISIHLMLLFIGIWRVIGGVITKFQYISCYCLSGSETAGSTDKKISIHLMLLFIRWDEIIVPKTMDFNTSHVTVYLRGKCESRNGNVISIHLMLLFIVIGVH